MNVLTHKRIRAFFTASLVGFGLLVSSCKQEVKEPVFEGSISQEAVTYLTEEAVSKQAVELYSALFGNGLREGEMPQVKDVRRVASSLRSAEGEDDHQGVLVVNFENNQGYVVLSEHIGNEPIIYACPKGYLDPGVPTDNPNLIPFLYNADALLSYNAGLGEGGVTDLIDGNGNPVPRPPIDESRLYRYEFGPWETTFQVGPLVQVEWDQGAPHNAKLTPINGQLPPVGCVATATSQIMSYHRWPAYNWDHIIAVSQQGYYALIDDPYCKEVLSLLHKDLGKPENLNISYSLGGSGALSENVPRTFRAYGYQCGELEEYDFDKIKSELYAHRPVYTRGKAKKHTTYTPKFLFWGGELEITYSGGHAWVIDGVRQIKRKVTTFLGTTGRVVDVCYQQKELVHCNMGWAPTNNGYYISKAFNLNNPPEMRSSVLRSTTTEGEDANFQFYHHIVTHIER